MMRQARGTGASAGVVTGSAFVVSRRAVVVGDLGDPKTAYEEAVASVVSDLEALATAAAEAGRSEAGAVLGAQALMVADPMLGDAVFERLDAGVGIQESVETSARELADMMAALDDEYLAARSADVLEAGHRLVLKLAGVEADDLGAITEPCIIVAPTLTAAETSVLDPELVLGFVTEEGGATSHVAVIARSLGIPAVVGAEGITGLVSTGVPIGIDGTTGELVIDPDDTTQGMLEERRADQERLRSDADAYRGVQISFDGRPFAVPANVGGPEDVARAVEAGADGIGLYRTEVLFLDRSEPPTEDEQAATYRAAVEAFSHPVVVRTFDIGGDKPAPYLDTPEEENPFLGERGVRIYRRFDNLFRGQVRALLRASAAGDLWIMIPMVATLDDFAQAREMIDEERAALSEAGVEIGDPRIGVMIEVPSAALIADRLAAEVDFFSIGTNDLTQYTMAADRTNGRLAAYADAAHPAVLSLCHLTARAAASADIPVSVCGEAASDPVLSVLFAAMGIAKLSVSAPVVNRVKATIDAIDATDARELLQAAASLSDAQAVRSLFEGDGPATR